VREGGAGGEITPAPVGEGGTGRARKGDLPGRSRLAAVHASRAMSRSGLGEATAFDPAAPSPPLLAPAWV